MAGNTLRLGVQFDDGGVTKKLNGISGAFDKIGGKGSGASLFGNVGAKAVAGGFNLIDKALSGVVDVAFDSIDQFSKLQQSMGAVESVFEKAQAPIIAFANVAATQAGLSRNAVFEMAAVIGAQLQSMGFSADEAAKRTVALEQRAADMAATFGGPTSDAVEAISALLRGETDPIEKYGVSIKQADINARIMADGLDTSTTAAKKNATSIAAMELLMDQTRKTEGQFAAQTDTLAEKQQIANAKWQNAQALLGQKLVPVMNTLADIAINAIDNWLPALGRGWQKVTDALRPVAHVLGEIVGLIQKAIGWIDKMIKRLKDLNVASIAVPPIPGLGTLPHFAQGGTVPGALNSPQLIVAHGGETVVPVGGGGGGHSHDVYMDGVKVGELLDRRNGIKLRRSAAAGLVT